MSTSEIGKQLVKFCAEGRNMESIETLYADDVESIEAAETPSFARVTRGKKDVLAKNQKWGEENEIHRAEAIGPYPHGDRFAVRFSYDVTHKQSGQRMAFDEIALFTVRGGKIVREEFFYDVG